MQLPPPVIVVVDDEESILLSIRRVLTRIKYHVEIFTDPLAALEFIRNNRVHVVISDIRMPKMMGQDFLAEVCEIQPTTFRVVLTGYADVTSTMEAVNKGGVSAFLQKPWETDFLTTVVIRGVEHTELIFENDRLNQKIREQNHQLEEINSSLEEKVMLRTKQIRAALIKLQDTYTANLDVLFNVMSSHPNIDGEYAKKVSKIAKRIAKQIRPDEKFVENVGLAAMMCELGVIGLPLDLINVPYALMNAAQLKQYKSQSYLASMILAPATHLADVTQMLSEQYRAFIPLANDEAPPCLGAQIIAVARDYQRMLDGRYMAEPLSIQKAMAELVKHKANRYSPTVIDLVCEQSELLDTTARTNNITIDNLEPGMILQEDLFTNKKILLLPEGHVFTNKTIQRIKQFQRSLPQELNVAVKLSTETS